MKKLLLLAASTGLALALSAPSAAARITYTLSGDFTGTIAGGNFTVPATFTGTADLARATSVSGVTLLPLTSLAAVAGGNTFTITTPAFFGLANSQSQAGFAFGASPLTNGFGFTNAAFSTYTGLADFAPTAVSFNSSNAAFDTDKGFVTIASAANLTFSAGVVPEPATWGLMALGFGLVGVAARRRRTLVAA